MIDSFLSQTGLKLEQGIWTSPKSSSVSYPEYGNEFCFQIEEQSYWFQHRNDCILAIMRHFPPAGVLFDIGGGNGVVASAMQRSGIDVILVEPGMEGAKNAKERGVKTVIRSTLQDAGFSESSLPAVGLFDVIEHIQDDFLFLKAVWSLLVPGGRIYLTTPAYNFLWSAEDDLAGHHRRYTRGLLCRKLESLGFQIDFATYIFAFLPLPILLFRTLPDTLRRKRKDAKSEHLLPTGLAGRAFHQLLQMELRLLRRKTALPFGGSLLVAARK